MTMTTTYYKATRKDGIIATRASTRSDFDRALVRNGSSASDGSTFIGRGRPVPKDTGGGELCQLEVITA